MNNPPIGSCTPYKILLNAREWTTLRLERLGNHRPALEKAQELLQKNALGSSFPMLNRPIITKMTWRRAWGNLLHFKQALRHHAAYCRAASCSGAPAINISPCPMCIARRCERWHRNRRERVWRWRERVSRCLVPGTGQHLAVAACHTLQVKNIESVGQDSFLKRQSTCGYRVTQSSPSQNPTPEPNLISITK